METTSPAKAMVNHLYAAGLAFQFTMTKLAPERVSHSHYMPYLYLAIILKYQIYYLLTTCIISYFEKPTVVDQLHRETQLRHKSMHYISIYKNSTRVKTICGRVFLFSTPWGAMGVKRPYQINSLLPAAAACLSLRNCLNIRNEHWLYLQVFDTAVYDKALLIVKGERVLVWLQTTILFIETAHWDLILHIYTLT